MVNFATIQDRLDRPLVTQKTSATVIAEFFNRLEGLCDGTHVRRSCRSNCGSFFSSRYQSSLAKGVRTVLINMHNGLAYAC